MKCRHQITVGTHTAVLAGKAPKAPTQPPPGRLCPVVMQLAANALLQGVASTQRTALHCCVCDSAVRCKAVRYATQIDVLCAVL